VLGARFCHWRFEHGRSSTDHGTKLKAPSTNLITDQIWWRYSSSEIPHWSWYDRYVYSS